MRRYDTILWDVDDTLLDFGRSEEEAVTKAFQKYGLIITNQIRQRYSVINLSYWKRLEQGTVDKLTVLRGRFLDLFAEFGITGVDVDAFREAYQTFLGSCYFYLEDSDCLVAKLRGEGYRQYIVTNGVAWTQRNKLMLAGLDVLTDGMFVSEELGANKPNPAFFEACFAQIAERQTFTRERVILVGDSLTSDIQGAVNAGIASCWYNPAGKENPFGPHPEYELKSLWDLPALLERS